jgi:phosphoadenosine phosphosulfate reductase
VSLIRHGKINLRWCEHCNLPLIGKKCSICGNEGSRVELTPPGDVRPAFDFDVKMIRDIVDSQFGEGCGLALLPEDKVFLLNRAPSEDRMDEIIVDGRVVGALRYDIFKQRFYVMLRMEGALRIEIIILLSLFGYF